MWSWGTVIRWKLPMRTCVDTEHMLQSPAFVVVALCPCSCHVVLCSHLLVSQVSWVGTGVLTDGRQMTNLSLCKISVHGVSGGRGRKKQTIVFELSVRSQHGITWHQSSNGPRNIFRSELGNSTSFITTISIFSKTCSIFMYIVCDVYSINISRVWCNFLYECTRTTETMANNTQATNGSVRLTQATWATDISWWSIRTTSTCLVNYQCLPPSYQPTVYTVRTMRAMYTKCKLPILFFFPDVTYVPSRYKLHIHYLGVLKFQN